MPKYKVFLVTEASTVVEVEAEDGDQAVELAFEQELPYAGAFDRYEFGEWQVPSEMYPNSSAKPELDYEEVTE